jgi:non-specific protein-tyrosine kinase
MQADQLRKLIRKWAIPIIVVTILGAAASYVVSRRLTPIYAATGSVLVIAGPGESVGSGSSNAPNATATAASLLTEPTLLQQVISTLHLNMTPDELSKNVSATAGTSTELVDVTANDPSPTRAAAIANALMSAYVAEVNAANFQRIAKAGAAIEGPISTLQTTINQEEQQLAADQRAHQDITALQAAITANTSELNQLSLQLGAFQAAQAQTLGAVSVAQPAPVPSTPASPRVLLNTIVGGLAALLLAGGAAYALEFFGQGLKTAEDVRERLGLPCLGVVPKFRHISGAGKPRAVNERHDEAVREAYRRLRINLLFATPDTDLKSVVITSVRAGEGKTCTAANLAVALASAERRVLLVDADLRKPDQHRLFQTSLEGGLSELILKRPTAAHVQVNGFRPTQFENLSLLTSGTVPPNPSELLASKRAMTLFQSIGPQQDMIVIDTAPAGLVTDPLSIAAGASATILVVEAGKTKAPAAAHAIDALREVGANVIGIVLNKTSRRVGAGYYSQGGYPSYPSTEKGTAHRPPSTNDVLAVDNETEPPAQRETAGAAARRP